MIKKSPIYMGIFAMFLVFCLGTTNTIMADQVDDHDFRITVSAPTNNTAWDSGSVQKLVWTDNNHHNARDHKITIWLSTEAGGDSTAVGTYPLPNYSPGGGSIEWTVCGAVSNECRIYLRHTSNDKEVRGKGGMRRGHYFKIQQATSIKPMKEKVPQFSLFEQSAKMLRLQVFDLNGKMIWETTGLTDFSSIQNKLSTGNYIIRFDNAIQTNSQKMNILR